MEITGPVSLLDFFSEARKTSQAGKNWKEFIHIVKVEIEGKRDRALLLHPSSEIVFPLRLERAAILETAIALMPKAWEKQSDGVTFYLAIRKEDDLLPTYVFKRYLSPELAEALPGWHPVRIDLTPYQGTNIELIFSTDPGPNDNPLYDWALWKEPRIYDPAADTDWADNE